MCTKTFCPGVKVGIGTCSPFLFCPSWYWNERVPLSSSSAERSREMLYVSWGEGVGSELSSLLHESKLNRKSEEKMVNNDFIMMWILSSYYLIDSQEYEETWHGHILLGLVSTNQMRSCMLNFPQEIYYCRVNSHSAQVKPIAVYENFSKTWALSILRSLIQSSISSILASTQPYRHHSYSDTKITFSLHKKAPTYDPCANICSNISKIAIVVLHSLQTIARYSSSIEYIVIVWQ